MKKFRLLAKLILVSMFALLAAAPVSQNARTQAASDFTTPEIEEEKKRQEEMEAELKDTNKFLSSLKGKVNSTVEYIQQLDNQMNKLSENIYDLELKAMNKKLEIEIAKAALVAAENDINQQYEAMKLRIQYMYENGNKAYMELFLDSKDVADFLNRAEYINKITEYDRDMLEQMKKAKENIELMKAKLEYDLEELEDTLLEVEEELKAVEILSAAKNDELKFYTDGIAETEDEIKALKEEIEAQEALIKEMEAIEKKRREEEEKNGLKLTYDGGRLVWPLPGKTRISSYFGYRTHPVTGEINSYHQGIDIPASTGTNIQACYKGQVAWAGYHSTAGNWIGIDHGNGLYTVYMHMSKILVKEGQMVDKCDIIGQVGSTGRSTGPHLHLGVRLNGKYVDPQLYVSPLVTK